MSGACNTRASSSTTVGQPLRTENNSHAALFVKRGLFGGCGDIANWVIYRSVIVDEESNDRIDERWITNARGIKMAVR